MVLEIQGWFWLSFISFEESFEKHCLVCNFSFQIISLLDLNICLICILVLLAYKSIFPTNVEEVKEGFKSVIILFELPKLAT